MSKAPASHEAVKVTVYIVSHNYARFLREAIESVFRQSFADWELILIDDNSTDNTLDIMECYARMPRVRLLHGQGNGLAKAANLAVSAARGEYLIRLDADDVFDENILLVLSNHLDANPANSSITRITYRTCPPTAPAPCSGNPLSRKSEDIPRSSTHKTDSISGTG